jgi:hypothetical protein
VAEELYTKYTSTTFNYFDNCKTAAMIHKASENQQSGRENYQNIYLDLPFENVIRKYRKKNLLKCMQKYPHGRFIEIGCGPDPLFNDITEFDKMIVIEPRIMFFEMAKLQADSNPKIQIINDLIENIDGNLLEGTFDFIYIGGFLHEIDSPEMVLEVVRKICSLNTMLYTWVPNAKSFHRLLAYEMGIIDSIYQKSRHDELFQRQKVYDSTTFNKLLISNGFKVIESGSYFIKPFTHDQMDEILDQGIVDKNCIDGLEKMITYMPDLGAELWTCFIKDDKIS